MERAAKPLKNLKVVLNCEEAEKLDWISTSLFDIRHQIDVAQEYLDNAKEGSEKDRFLRGCQEKLDDMQRALNTIEVRLFDPDQSTLIFSNYRIQIDEAGTSIKRAYENLGKLLPALKSHRDIKKVQQRHAERKSQKPMPVNETIKRTFKKPRP